MMLGVLNINQKEALDPEDDWDGMIESVDLNNNYEHNNKWENSCMVDSKKRTNDSNDDDGMKADDNMDWFAMIIDINQCLE
jgi:hypothetical protein